MSKIKPRKTCRSEIETLQRRLEEAEETLGAIRNGEVDALVVAGPHGDQVFTLKDADRPYRQLVEQMQEGACTLTVQGGVLFANAYLAHMLGVQKYRFWCVDPSTLVQLSLFLKRMPCQLETGF